MTDSSRQAWGAVFLRPQALEADAAFRATLAQLLRTGLQWGGAVGIVGVAVLVLVHGAVLGRPMAWWYPQPVTPDVFVLWDKTVVVLACLGVMALGRSGCRLSVGRAGGGAVALGIAAVSLVHDAYRGMLSVEYLVLVYLLAVAVIPYRPWQAALLGVLLTGLFYGLGTVGLPGTAAADPGLVDPGHLVRMGFGTVVLTGVAALLYATRYQQHRARRQAETLHQQVAELEQAKSRFFADVSHEFRTPLTLLLGSIREALDGRFGDLAPALRDRLAVMDDQAQRMKRLLDQLLDLSALEADRMTLAVRAHDIAHRLRGLLPPFRQWARDRDIDLQVEVGPDQLHAWVDGARFDEIVADLLSNAIAYTPAGGTVRVRLDAEADRARLAIRDAGPGLPEAVHDRVFGREDTPIPAGAAAEMGDWIGVGIGLAHARALVRRHGGHFEIETEPGFGTECLLRLPLGAEHIPERDRAAEAEADGDAPRAERGRARGGPRTPPIASPEDAPAAPTPTVLVVDDETDMRAYLQALLQPRYRVVTTPDAEAALDRLREQPVDLVLSDVQMPGRDGRALCRAIRDDEALRALPVILLTGRPDDDTALSSLRAGADAWIEKPFDPAELEARIETLIEIRRLLRERLRVPDWMAPAAVSVEDGDAAFLETVLSVVDAHIDNSAFGVDWLAEEVDLSARHLRRRLKEVVNLSPAGLIRARRLQRAASLLEDGADTVAAVASAVGYRDASHFSRLFREAFGCAPTEYAQQASSGPDGPDETA